MKKWYFVVLVSVVSIFSCSKSQDRSIKINGQVLDQNTYKGVPNVTIYINRGLHESMWPTAYKKYDSVLTNSEGNYSYHITDYEYNYQVCCKLPAQYSLINQFCKEVDASIINGKTIPNVINFKVIP